MKKGKLLIFEGFDCCGKTTQLNLVYNNLISNGYKVIKTREPGGTLVGEEIRKILKKDIDFNLITESYLFATSRAEHNIKIKKLLDENYIVLCDRHILSSIAYQGKEIAIEVNKKAMQILDGYDFKYIYFDLDYDEYQNRIKKRNLQKDIFEQRLNDLENFNRIKKNYKSGALSYNAYIIDANDDINNINVKVMKIINDLMKEEE